MKMLYRGEVIQCERCQLDLYALRRDLRSGDRLMAADFEGVGLVQAPKPFTRMECCECGAAYGRVKPNFGTELHVKNVGWV